MGASTLGKSGYWVALGAADRQSSCVTSRRAVFQIRSGELKRLLKVVRLQLGIVPEEIVPVWIERQSLHHSTHRQPHATDARLAIHLVRVPGYAIEVLHASYSDTFRGADA